MPCALSLTIRASWFALMHLASMGGTVSSLDALCKLGLAKRTDGRGPGEVPCRAPGESEPPAAGDAGDAVASPSRGEMLFSLTMAGRKLIRMHRRPHAQAASAGGVAGCGAAIAGSACGKVRDNVDRGRQRPSVDSSVMWCRLVIRT